MQAEEILHLGAGNQDRDAVGEANDNRTGNKLHCRAHSGDAHDEQENTRHDRAHKQSVNAMHGDDPRDYHNESPGRSSDLCLGTTEQRNKEAGHDCAVDASLRRKARRDGKCHRQGQGNQSHGDSGNHIAKEFGGVVITKTEDGLR